MLALIAQLPEKRGCSILLSSHLLPDVEAVCHSAILLNEGQVLYSGPIADMHEGSTQELYEVRVKAGGDKLGAALEKLGCSVEHEGGAINVVLPQGGAPDLIFERALAEGIQVRHLAPVRQTLESAFVRILRRSRGGGA